MRWTEVGIAGILAAVALVIAGQLLLKLGMTRVGVVGLAALRRPLRLLGRLVATPAVIGGLALYAVSAVAWILVLSRFELSYAYPFLAVSYVGVTIAAVRTLGERFSPIQWLGVAMVASGVALVAATG